MCVCWGVEGVTETISMSAEGSFSDEIGSKRVGNWHFSRFFGCLTVGSDVRTKFMVVARFYVLHTFFYVYGLKHSLFPYPILRGSNQNTLNT